jgi:hypothetical protein
MKLDNILIREGPQEYESLALSLRAVASAAGTDLDYDDVCAALGASFTAVSTVAEASPGWWMTFGRDVFIEPAARLFGLHLRDLHPPDVAVDMLSAEEFGQHWELSYKPLVRRALENGQPVLAWHGWPDYRWPFWGVVTAQAGQDFEGTTLWAGGERQLLAQPALQCHVVERCEPFLPPRDRLLAMAMEHADACMNRAPYAAVACHVSCTAIVTGPAAFDAWEHWLEARARADRPDEGAWNDHRQHAEFLASARQSAALFLRRIQQVVPTDRRDVLLAAAEACDDTVRLLSESRDENAAQSRFSSRQGIQQLLASVHAAEAADRRLAMRVEELAQVMRQT